MGSLQVRPRLQILQSCNCGCQEAGVIRNEAGDIPAAWCGRVLVLSERFFVRGRSMGGEGRAFFRHLASKPRQSRFRGLSPWFDAGDQTIPSSGTGANTSSRADSRQPRTHLSLAPAQPYYSHFAPAVSRCLLTRPLLWRTLVCTTSLLLPQPRVRTAHRQQLRAAAMVTRTATKVAIISSRSRSRCRIKFRHDQHELCLTSRCGHRALRAPWEGQ